jgi:hypothetical protein
LSRKGIATPEEPPNQTLKIPSKTRRLLNQQEEITQAKQRRGDSSQDGESRDEGRRNRHLTMQTAAEKSMIELHRSGVPGKG